MFIRGILKCWFSTYFEVHIFENNHTWPLNLDHCAMLILNCVCIMRALFQGRTPFRLIQLRLKVYQIMSQDFTWCKVLLSKKVYIFCCSFIRKLTYFGPLDLKILRFNALNFLFKTIILNFYNLKLTLD